MFQPSAVSTLPSAGVGAMAVATGAGPTNGVMMTLVLLLASWTCLAAGKAILRLTPKTEQ
jgi:hypothetical protein